MTVVPKHRDSTGPTLERERIDSLDILRGVALLGILIINIKSFSMPSYVFPFPNIFESLEGWNMVVWVLAHVLVELKFMTMFCIMFGAGILLMSEHRDAAGAPVLLLHYRRMVLMIVFGLIHAYAIWYGDILVTYAVCGCFVVWLRKLGPGKLLLVGGTLFSLGSIFFIWRTLSIQANVEPHNMYRPLFYPGYELDFEIQAYRGTWREHLPYRIDDARSIQLYSLPRISFWRLTGLMCLGMALYKWKILQAARSRLFYWIMAILFGGVGLPAMILSAHWSIEHNFSPAYEMGAGALLLYWASLPTSLMWIALVMLLAKARHFRRVRYVLACYGRMAFTNYIGQSLIATWIFYGYGLGWFGSVSRVEQIGVVIAIWAVQLTISPIWLRYFQFGPLEWLWRTGAYLRFQPMLRRPEPEMAVAVESHIDWGEVIERYSVSDPADT